MVISIPEILTTESSGKYILSIRLRPGGLSFTGYDSDEEQSFFARTIESDRTMSYLSFVQEVFFANEWLTYPFKQVHIVFTEAPFLLVPDEVYEEEHIKDLFSFIYTAPAEICLANHLEEDNSQLLFGVDKDLYEFFSRSVIQPEFHHRYTSLLPLWKNQSKTDIVSQMFLDFCGKKMSVFCYSRGKLSFANTYDVDNDNEKLYFAMSVWKKLGLNQLIDHLNIFCDDKGESSRLREVFEVYIRNVREVDLQSDLKMREINPIDYSLDKIALAL